MQENFLHYLWRTHHFDTKNLKTTEGLSLDILNFGEYNLNAGPDFFNAIIRIEDMTWAGNIEMHVKSSDWLAHGHQHDAGYNNVILHVVFEEDTPIFPSTPRGGDASALSPPLGVGGGDASALSPPLGVGGEDTAALSPSLGVAGDTAEASPPLGVGGGNGRIPCLVLKPYIPQGIFKKYWALLNNTHWIPCQNHFSKVPELTKTMWYERMLIERLEQKTEAIAHAFDRNKNDWEETFYQFITRNFGLTVNTDPMIWLAQSLPHILLAKHKNNLFQLEALLFGQSGLLQKDFQDEYPNVLKKEYDFLKHKHTLTPLEGHIWKFAKMRPPAFPTIRLAQLAGLVHQSVHLFSKVLDCEAITDIEKLFTVQVGTYWTTHYNFDAPPSVFSNKKLGQDTIALIIINTIVPFLFYYGKMRKEEQFEKRAFQFLEQLKPEKNQITEGWQALGEKQESAYKTQALIQLKKNYCDAKRCVDCAIGNAVLTA